MCSGTHWISRPRAIALLEELHRVRDLLRLALEVAGLLEQFDDPLLGAEHRLAGQLRVRLRGHVRRRVGQDPAVPADHRPRGQLQLPPPGDVVEVAEGADHRDARALVRLGEAVRDHGHLDAEDRRPHGRAEQPLVALVVGVRDQRDAGRDQLGPGGLDEDWAVRGVEGDPVVGARALPVLQFGLGDRGAERDVPEGRRLLGVGLSSGEVVQEHPLCGGAGGFGDRPVDVRPVDRQTDPAPELLELRLVLGGQPHAQLHEVAPRDGDLVLARLLRRLEVRVVVHGRVAAHAVVVLHPSLRRQAVVVPAHRVVDVPAAHALVARHEVGVGVAEDVPHVQ
jgi:hypothetical protein